MILVPKHEGGSKLKHLGIDLSTIGSTSAAAPGTGLVCIPVYAWVTASAVGSARYLNGTGGSALFHIKAAAGGVAEICFWEEPSNLSANKCPVIETETAGMGVSGFHVWYATVRASAGQSATGQ